MRKFLATILFLSVVLIARAQTNLAGNYIVSGYLYHSNNAASRSINLTKTIIEVTAGKYQVTLGDLGASNYSFQFEVDSSNNLINWVAVGATPVSPSSGFMTLDNPGNFSYAAPVPGSVPYQHSVYNNTYNPATKTFYMHYGYAGAATGQEGYTRQIYEKYRMPTPAGITSVTPMSGTAFTQVTIKGNNLSGTNLSYGISFGNIASDSAVIISDSVIVAWVASGASGNVRVDNGDGSDTAAGFIYMPVGAVIDTQWRYLGAAGFSNAKAFSVNIAVDTSNIPYVVFADSATGKVKLMKLAGTNWVNAGLDVSDGKSSNAKIAIDINNNPIVAYADSTIAGSIAVKKFDGTSWINLNAPATKGRYAITTDKGNFIYLSVVDSARQIKILRYDGSNWTVTLNAGQSYNSGEVDIVVDKNNTPYIIYDDFNFNGQATVKKYDGNAWVTVGNAGFTNSLYGIFYGSIKIDTDGNPVVAFQEDDGFERISAYKFTGGVWTAIGAPKFSKGRSHNMSLAMDSRNNISVAFTESSYNKQGTVRTYNATNGLWEITGSRGWLPAAKLESDALATDRENTSLVAFSDLSNGGKVSVMRLIVNSTWTGANGSGWENPANWSTGTLPTSASNVIIPQGATVILNTNATIHSLDVSPGASFTVLAGKVLTVF